MNREERKALPYYKKPANIYKNKNFLKTLFTTTIATIVSSLRITNEC